jgi:hypothetical protein
MKVYFISRKNFKTKNDVTLILIHYKFVVIITELLN